MKKEKEKLTFHDFPTNYSGLCDLLPPRPIHSASDFRKTTQISDVLAGHDLSTDQQDYFDLLCRLIEDWEKSKVPRPKATGLETLQALLDSHNMTPSDLSKVLGVHRTLGAMILRGERKLTLKHVKALAKFFAVSTDAFID
ncbi:MAG TPA: helix-turn-helix domain-containing protein [Verrucomicrobiae bacterium]|nr:helix-turn-helix domain-containing protein [Verrucomicrobiae bacterium]